MESKDILKSDVLDIIFEGRNKEYGAYELRKNYSVAGPIPPEFGWAGRIGTHGATDPVRVDGRWGERCVLVAGERASGHPDADDALHPHPDGVGGCGLQCVVHGAVAALQADALRHAGVRVVIGGGADVHAGFDGGGPEGGGRPGGGDPVRPDCAGAGRAGGDCVCGAISGTGEPAGALGGDRARARYPDAAF